MESERLNCVLFGHIMLEREENSHIPNYGDLTSMMLKAGIKLETPHDMLEWIWIHMAINAGGGAGSFCMSDAIRGGADAFVTGMLPSFSMTTAVLW